MATAEGVFPKVGNDPLFNTEINSFENSTKVYQVGSFIGTITSGTAFQDVGSILIPAGSIVNPGLIEIDYLCSGVNAAVTKAQINISGLSNFGGGTPNSNFQDPVGKVIFNVGSPGMGGVWHQSISSDSQGNQQASHTRLPNFDSSATTVLLFKIVSSVTVDGGYDQYIVRLSGSK